MIARRVGIVLAVLLSLAGAAPALDIRQDASQGALSALPVAVALFSVGVAVATLVLVVPAWRGGRRAGLAIAVLQLAAILPSLPAFFAPIAVVPAGGVVLAAVGSILNVIAFALILVDLSTALLYAAALVVVVALYAAIVALVASLVPEGATRIVQTGAAIVVALVFHPVLMLLHRIVGRSLYGNRGDPAGTVREIGRQLSDRTDPVAGAVDELAAALRLPHIQLLEGEAIVAESGRAVPDPHAVIVPFGIDARTSYRVTLRPGERVLHPDDRAALELLAPPLALLLREAELIGELRTARAAQTNARENERAVLHRDLHDGLGPLLTGALLRADAARNLLRTGSDEVVAQLDLARAELRTAIAEIRRVVYGLRPLELEQRGLWHALRHHAERAGATLRLPEPPPGLAAAAEIAAYRIVVESLANAERHAAGFPATVDVVLVDDQLHITVENGAPDDSSSEGVGLRSIRIRAEELGGGARIGPVGERWIMHAWLPLGDG